MQAANDVLERLRKEPVRVPLQGVADPATGATATITLGPEDFQRDPTLRSLESPAFVLSLYHGHYGRWAQGVYAARRSRSGEFPVIGPLIDTSLGVTPKRKYLLENDPAIAVLGRWNFHSYLATAEAWPTVDVGDAFRTPKDSPTPVVFLHGDWDLQTPVENTLQIAPFFRNGHVILVERAGHGVLGQIEQFPAVTSALARFLATGETAGLPTRIAIPAPKLSAPSFPLVDEDRLKQ